MSAVPITCVVALALLSSACSRTATIALHPETPTPENAVIMENDGTPELEGRLISREGDRLEVMQDNRVVVVRRDHVQAIDHPGDGIATVGYLMILGSIPAAVGGYAVMKMVDDNVGSGAATAAGIAFIFIVPSMILTAGIIIVVEGYSVKSTSQKIVTSSNSDVGDWQVAPFVTPDGDGVAGGIGMSVVF